MSIYSDRYIPNIIRNVTIPSVGFTFRTGNDEGEIRFENDYFKFYIDDTLVLKFGVSGITGYTDSRKGKESITAAGSPNTISYSSTLNTTDYMLLIRCYDGSGNNVDYQINSESEDGFTITVPIDCTIVYRAEII
jgi:hypothetical protein